MTNKKCIVRLSRYKKALYRFKNIGFVKVFSDTLADAIGVTSAQVRKDFSLFGISGNKRGGYNIDELIDKLQSILGKDQVQHVVVVGVGNIGRALMNYGGFEKEGIKIIAGFDIDPTKFRREDKVPIFPLDELKTFAKDHNVTIGILSVPDIAAQHASEVMLEGGIKGILNFSSIRLKGREDSVINNVNLEAEIENLIYFVNISGKVKPEDIEE
ncbi:MAG TPA: redox-sensing transcriptional repressor Rex [Candidatus Omnitrophota bacterium]|nr:redox-sensing transcriptional repressor Rex [Candidatus Omnitrophota bacterium]